MKTWIACLLSIYVLVGAMIPCSVFDKCEEETVQTTKAENKKGCNDCPPFCICAGSNGFTVNNTISIVDPVTDHVCKVYNEYRSFFKSVYLSVPIQPPRLS